MGLRSYSDYLDQDFTPGEINRASVSVYDLDPMKEAEYIAKLRWDFAPKIDSRGMATDAFQEFMKLRANPDAFLTGKMKLPDQFVAMQQLAGGGY